jgi:hypothetical protein
MGDRSNVVIDIQDKNLSKKLNKLIDERYGMLENEGCSENNLVSSFYFEECNYSEVGIENFLKENKIPFDKSWVGGSGYEDGFEYWRVVDGVFKSVVFTENEQNHVSLEALVNAHAAGNVDDFIRHEVERRNVQKLHLC